MTTSKSHSIADDFVTVRRALRASSYKTGSGQDHEWLAAPDALRRIEEQVEAQPLGEFIFQKERADRAEAALREVHGFECGCDRPGNPSVCIAPGGSVYAILDSNPASTSEAREDVGDA